MILLHSHKWTKIGCIVHAWTRYEQWLRTVVLACLHWCINLITNYLQNGIGLASKIRDSFDTWCGNCFASLIIRHCIVIGNTLYHCQDPWAHHTSFYYHKWQSKATCYPSAMKKGKGQHIACKFQLKCNLEENMHESAEILNNAIVNSDARITALWREIKMVITYHLVSQVDIFCSTGSADN